MLWINRTFYLNDKYNGNLNIYCKDACINAKELNVKNVILYHTEDKNLANRKELYVKEGKEEFDGKIYMPDDLDVIDLL